VNLILIIGLMLLVMYLLGLVTKTTMRGYIHLVLVISIGMLGFWLFNMVARG